MQKRYKILEKKCVICGKKFVKEIKYSSDKRVKTCSVKCCRKLAFKNTDMEIRNKKISDSKKGKKNNMWKGDKVGYHALHDWIKRRLPKPELCQKCKLKEPNDLDNKGIYDRNLKNWEWLCRKCHMTKDGRLKKLIKFNKRRLKDKKCKMCGKKYKPKSSTSEYCSKSCYRTYANKNRINTPY